MTSINVAENLLRTLEDDDVFKTFLDGDFDANAYASRTIQSRAIVEQLAKLAEGINLLDKEIHSQVVLHHQDLLSQATGVETLEGVLQMMQTRIQSLLMAVERIRDKVTEPYNKISTRTVQLRRLQETCDLLRRVIRFMYLSKRLLSQLQGGQREITKAAQSLSELDYLCEGVDLSGLEVIEQDRRFVKQARREVEGQAERMLEQGMESQNQTQVATALQVFYNLGSLAGVVDRVIASSRDTLHRAVRAALDVDTMCQVTPPHNRSGGPGKASFPAPGNTAAFRATLWTNMEKLMDNIYASFAQVHHLQKVLSKKRDPVTHVCFIDDLSKDKDHTIDLTRDFWNDITAILCNEFSNSSSGNTFLKQAFEGEYPKLLRLYNDLWRRLQQFAAPSVTPLTGEGKDTGEMTIDHARLLTKRDDYDPERQLKQSLSLFENMYLSKSLSRLFDPINLVFASGLENPPTRDEIDNIVKVISSEINVASIDPALSVTVAKNVAKTVQLFTVKSENMLVTNGEASQVIGPPTAGQALNAAIVDSLFYFHHAISQVLQSSPQPSAANDAINNALLGIVSLMSNAINPLLSSVSDALESIVLTMHNEDFSMSAANTKEGDAYCSLYMKEMQQFVTRVHASYLAQFHCSDFIMDSVQPVACRAIELFVRHSSLLRPLGEGGKVRLAADFAQMEAALAPLCRRVADLGRAYRLLRAFRPLLFQTNEHIAKSPALGEIVPYSTAIHFLFSRAPEEMKAPQEAVNWQVGRYSRWLDDHPSEKDRLNFIKGALESYVQAVRVKGGREFASVYPIMLDLLQRGLLSVAPGLQTN